MNDIQLGCLGGVILGIPVGILVGAALAVFVLWRVFDQGHIRRITIEQHDNVDRPEAGIRSEG